MELKLSVWGSDAAEFTSTLSGAVFLCWTGSQGAGGRVVVFQWMDGFLAPVRGGEAEVGCWGK